MAVIAFLDNFFCVGFGEAEIKRTSRLVKKTWVRIRSKRRVIFGLAASPFHTIPSKLETFVKKDIFLANGLPFSCRKVNEGVSAMKEKIIERR